MNKLRLLMFQNNIKNKDLANLLNLHRNTIYLKLRNKSKFTLQETIFIKQKFFPNETLENLLD